MTIATYVREVVHDDSKFFLQNLFGSSYVNLMVAGRFDENGNMNLERVKITGTISAIAERILKTFASIFGWKSELSYTVIPVFHPKKGKVTVRVDNTSLVEAVYKGIFTNESLIKDTYSNEEMVDLISLIRGTAHQDKLTGHLQKLRKADLHLPLEEQDDDVEVPVTDTGKSSRASRAKGQEENEERSSGVGVPGAELEDPEEKQSENAA